MVLLHSVAMNGGLLHSVERLEPDRLAAAVDAYRLFGLDGAAQVIEWVADQSANPPASDDAADELEFEADRRYAEVVPDDSTLVESFERYFREHPSEFAPVQ